MTDNDWHHIRLGLHIMAMTCAVGGVMMGTVYCMFLGACKW